MLHITFCSVCGTVVPNQARGRPLWRSSASDDPVLSGPFSCSECPSGDVAWWTDLGERQHIAAVYMRLKQNVPDGSKIDGADKLVVVAVVVVEVDVVVSTFSKHEKCLDQMIYSW